MFGKMAGEEIMSNFTDGNEIFANMLHWRKSNLCEDILLTEIKYIGTLHWLKLNQCEHVYWNYGL